jgi:UDP-N-acetylglucosamine:LPS N-acetylglucosamine transferase
MLAGGGGHTGYGSALAEQLYKHVDLFFLIPEGDKISEKKLKKYGKVEYLVKPRGPKTSNAYFIPKLFKSFLYSTKYLQKDFDVIISTGSNFCFAPAVYSWFKGIPVVNIESPVRFTKPSLTAKYLQPLSEVTALHWPEQRRILNGRVVGPILPKAEYPPWQGGYILVTGGTFGHKKLFDTINYSTRGNIVLQTGRVDPEPYAKSHSEWVIFRYSTEFQKILSGAEVVVTHFGSTVLEAYRYQKPTILVPNPEWTRTVGVEDAKILAKKVNATVIENINLEELEMAINEATKTRLPRYREGAKNLAEIILKI